MKNLEKKLKIKAYYMFPFIFKNIFDFILNLINKISEQQKKLIFFIASSSPFLKRTYFCRVMKLVSSKKKSDRNT